jgi:protein associated with RNAse G/E
MDKKSIEEEEEGRTSLVDNEDDILYAFFHGNRFEVNAFYKPSGTQNYCTVKDRRASITSPSFNQ